MCRLSQKSGRAIDAWPQAKADRNKHQVVVWYMISIECEASAVRLVVCYILCVGSSYATESCTAVSEAGGGMPRERLYTCNVCTQSVNKDSIGWQFQTAFPWHLFALFNELQHPS